MNLTSPVDLYCERLDPGFWAEPANALSNGAFFIAAALAWRFSRRHADTLPAPLRVLPALIALIGIGSAAFHTLGLLWTEYLDVACIGIFIHYFIVCFLRYRAGLPWRYAWLGSPAFVLLGVVIGLVLPAQSFNGSTSYFPAAIGLLAMAVFLRPRDGRDAARYLAAAAVFALSLTFRTEDLDWCSRFPLGTHWIWHSLNAVTLWLATDALLRAKARLAA